ncbi:hypothetical protein GE09DRAFT_94405 [Coniochaeta sp. 2T2.1]|nr:hypothetical protein GE09DRAFT_94405 [Coniochaeta sp. 2T2.1]
MVEHHLLSGRVYIYRRLSYIGLANIWTITISQILFSRMATRDTFANRSISNDTDRHTPCDRSVSTITPSRTLHTRNKQQVSSEPPHRNTTPELDPLFLANPQLTETGPKTTCRPNAGSMIQSHPRFQLLEQGHRTAVYHPPARTTSSAFEYHGHNRSLKWPSMIRLRGTAIPSFSLTEIQRLVHSSEGSATTAMSRMGLSCLAHVCQVSGAAAG